MLQKHPALFLSLRAPVFTDAALRVRPGLPKCICIG
jgi:hypothetical protein